MMKIDRTKLFDYSIKKGLSIWFVTFIYNTVVALKLKPYRLNTAKHSWYMMLIKKKIFISKLLVNSNEQIMSSWGATV